MSFQVVIPGVWGLGGAAWGGSSALVSTSPKDFPLSQPVITAADKEGNTKVDPSITSYSTSLHSCTKKSTHQSRELWSTPSTGLATWVFFWD